MEIIGVNYGQRNYVSLCDFKSGTVVNYKSIDTDENYWGIVVRHFENDNVYIYDLETDEIYDDIENYEVIRAYEGKIQLGKEIY